MDSQDFAENSAVGPRQLAALLKWSDSPAVPAEFPFVEQTGLQVELTEPVKSPLSYFRLIFTENIIKMIVDSTNSFAQKSNPNWTVTTAEEIEAILGIFLRKDSIKHIPKFDVPKKLKKIINNFPFRPKMCSERFNDLNTHLRFSGDQQISDAIVLIKPLVEALTDQIATIYYPTRNLSVLNQKLMFPRPSDSTDVTVAEMFQLHDANGFVYNFLMKESVKLTPTSGAPVVEKLVENLLDRGHSIYLKCEFNSVDLASKLLRQKTYLTGTYVPEVSASFPPGMFTSNSFPLQFQCDGIFVEKIPRKSVKLSTEIGLKPFINGNDLDDSVLTMTYRKVLSSVYKQREFLNNIPNVPVNSPYSTKIFIYLLKICVQNAFVLYRNRVTSRRLKYLEFKFTLAKQLLQ